MGTSRPDTHWRGKPALGATYVTIQFVAASVYQQSNWYTHFIERNRQAVLDVNVDAAVNGIQLRDTRVSDPVDLRRRDAQVDFGYSGVIVDRLPTTYSLLRVTVGLSKTSTDGAEELVKTAADLSKTFPTLKISQSAMGMVSAAKAVADFLFTRQLMQRQLSSWVDFPSSGNLFPAGVYVALAGDNQSDYQKYLGDPAPGQTGLVWTGRQLTWNGRPLEKVSYFVLNVRYDSRVFTQPIDALGLNAVAKPWVGLYLIARREVPTITKLSETDKVVGGIRSHLLDAQTILEQDPDFVEAEREQVHNAIKADIEEKVNAQIVAVAASEHAAAAAAPTATAGAGISSAAAAVPSSAAVTPIRLDLPDNLADKTLAREIVADQARTMAATQEAANKKPPPR